MKLKRFVERKTQRGEQGAYYNILLLSGKSFVRLPDSNNKIYYENN